MEIPYRAKWSVGIPYRHRRASLAVWGLQGIPQPKDIPMGVYRGCEPYRNP